MPDINFEDLASEMLDDLKSTGQDFWDKLNDEQRPVIEKAAKDIARAALLLVTDKENADLHKEVMLAAKSTIASETALAALQAEKRLKAALWSGFQKLVGVGLSLL